MTGSSLVLANGQSATCTITNDDETSSLSVAKAQTTNADEDTSGSITLGDTLTNVVTATNTGTVTQTNVTVTDTKISPASNSCLSLAPGGTCVLTGTYLVTQADVDAGSIANTGSVTSAQITTPVTDDLSVTVVIPVVAVDDSATGIDGVAGEAGVLNVYGNDTQGGVAIDPAAVTLTIDPANPVPAELGFNPETGNVRVKAGTPAGTYTFTYTICEIANPANCDTATVSVTVVTPAIVTGTVYLDINGNGIFDGDPPAGAGYLVELVDSSGTVLGTAITDTDGFYSITAVPGTNYKINFRAPSGGVIGEIDNVTLIAGTTVIDKNQPIDPSGVVYNSQTRQPVAGATVTLNDANNNPLPLACFVNPAQQNQLTGPSGAYRFDIVPGAAAQCPVRRTDYIISLVTPAGYKPGISTLLPPKGGTLNVNTCPVDAVPGGSCDVSASSSAPLGETAVYYTHFSVATGAPDLVNNHIAIDPILRTAGFTKRAKASTIHRGEKVAYVIEATDVSLSPVRFVDVMPPGFAFIKGSAQVNGTTKVPTIDGQRLVFDGLEPDATGKIHLELTLVTTAAITPGSYTNKAQLIDPATDALVASAKAVVEVISDPVFDCGEIIGRVFDDKNSDGYQNDGEPGLPGVRVATVNGLLITTDKFGRFHVGCADVPDADIGSNFIMKLDTRTLPTGYRVTTENPRVVRLTRGKMTKLNFGASVGRVVRLDLKDEAFAKGGTALMPKWKAGLAQLVAILDKQPSTLRLTYHSGGKDKNLASKRLTAIESMIETMWKQRPGRYRLPIETRLIGAK